MSNFNVGLFFDNESTMVEEYRRHSQRVANLARCWKTTSVNPKEKIIITDDTRYMYFFIDRYETVYKIAGLEFQAIFVQVSDIDACQYIMTRFRPK